MRIVTCVVLGLSLAASAPALATGPYSGPPARAYIRPPAGVVHVGPRTAGPGYRNGRHSYGTGFGGYVASPGIATDEGAGRSSTQSQVFAPRTNVWYGPPLVGQGDIGYVTQPAIYDVGQELAKRPSFLPGVRK
jgi:hypothetical protein